MNRRFWIFGIIVSVVVHVAFLIVLSMSSSGPAPAAEGSAASSTESSSDPVASTPVASTPVKPTPVTSTPVAATPVAATPVAPAPVAATPVARPTTRRPTARPVTLPDAHSMPAHEPEPTPEAEWVTYTVKKGDKLERLVKRAGCSMSEAARYNKTTVKKLSALKIGQRIKLPKFKED